jgi:hypothetical protein
MQWKSISVTGGMQATMEAVDRFLAQQEELIRVKLDARAAQQVWHAAERFLAAPQQQAGVWGGVSQWDAGMQRVIARILENRSQRYACAATRFSPFPFLLLLASWSFHATAPRDSRKE